MDDKHVPTFFNDNLMHLDNIIAEMGGMAEVQLADAIEALLKRDTNKAAQVIETDSLLDNLETEIAELAVKMLASHQPMTKNLRVVITALRTASIIERIADYAKNIAKRSTIISQSIPISPTKAIGRMGGQVQVIIKMS